MMEKKLISEIRPWGSFTVLHDSDKFKVKIIEVDPGHRLSYQSHRYRQEHWTVVEGEAVVVLDDQEYALRPSQSIDIGRGAKHRLENRTAHPVRIVEVQLGDYFGEDDIVRYEDDYHRASG